MDVNNIIGIVVDKNVLHIVEEKDMVIMGYKEKGNLEVYEKEIDYIKVIKD